MLRYAERHLRELDRLIKDTEALVLNGGVSDMERYRFLMGRIEGIRLAEQSARDILKKSGESDEL